MPYFPEGMALPDTQIPLFKPYWEHAKKHELVIQKCSDCGTLRQPPEVLCHNCHSFNYEWEKVSGKGVVYSYQIAHYPPHPALKDRVPFNIVIVELSGTGNVVRTVGNLVDCPNDEIKIGMPVEVTWDDINDDVTLPQWKRATPQRK